MRSSESRACGLSSDRGYRVLRGGLLIDLGPEVQLVELVTSFEGLSQDQRKALYQLLDALQSGQRVLLLVGAAGTGKTFLMKYFARAASKLGYKLGYMAPSGKAAVRLSESVGKKALTIHSALYRKVHTSQKGTPVFSEPGQLCHPGTIVVCDEASMVSDFLHRDILLGIPRGAFLMYVGDKEQLEPVVGTWGVDFDNPTAELTEVHRQALQSAIVQVGTDVRLGGKMPMQDVGSEYSYREGSMASAGSWVASAVEEGRDAIALTPSNDARCRVNRLARRELGYLGEEDPILPGEQLVILLNNKHVGRYNGETLVVHETDWFGDLMRLETSLGPLFVHPDAVGQDVSVFKSLQKKHPDPDFSEIWVHVDYGYALTVHKAQGSEFDEVLFVLDGKTKWMIQRGLLPGAKRLAYTALTRAKKRFIRMDVR